MIAACMLFDSMHSLEGWLCCNSILKFDPVVNIYVLCLDERVYYEADYYRQCYNNVMPIRLYELENYFAALLGARSSRPWNAYTQTCKTFLPEYIFDKYGEQILFYVDSDMYFWSSSEHIEKTLGSHSFMVASREQEPPPKQGRFNGGFFVCKNDAFARKFLKWWQDKTIEWCLWQPGPDDRFGEEGYLNIFYEQPNLFSGVLISHNPGINMAYWNMYKHNLALNNNNIIIDNRFSLVCFHYQGMKIYKGDYNPCVEFKNKVVEHIYDTYYKEYTLFKEEFLNGMDCYRRR